MTNAVLFARLLRRESNEVAAQRLARTGANLRRLIACHRPHEGIHREEVRPTMSAHQPSAGVVLLVVNRSFLRQEIEMLDRVAASPR